MRKSMRALGLLSLAGLVWLLLILSEWLPRPTQAQLDGISALAARAAQPQGERNAFALFWLFGYEVPENELESVLGEDLARYQADAAAGKSLVDYPSVAEGRYRKLPQPPSNDPLLCDAWKPDCLERVRGQTDAVRAHLAEYSERLARGDLLAGYDHVHYRFAPRLDAPIAAPIGLYQLQLTAAALAFVEGDRDGAYARLCRDGANWRRLRANADSIIVDMIGVAELSGAIALYAQMLETQPADFTPPCPEVFAPLTEVELDQCAEFALEQQVWSNSLPVAFSSGLYGDGGWTGALAGRLVNQQHLVRIASAEIGRYCSSAHRERITARDPAALPAIEQCATSAWVFDPLGCVLAEQVMFSYHPYFRRLLDLDARLKLLGLSLWLRAQGGDPAQAFERRPPELDSKAHAFALAEARLRMQNLDRARAEHTELPLAKRVPARPD